ncbi:hypothetical protein B0H12DRAFT_1154409 [Mycena haematopus]|nr:hypothetical protein B0H12DRAFT_1154409 [Mycena haematopus]
MSARLTPFFDFLCFFFGGASSSLSSGSASDSSLLSSSEPSANCSDSEPGSAPSPLSTAGPETNQCVS